MFIESFQYNDRMELEALELELKFVVTRMLNCGL